MPLPTAIFLDESMIPSLPPPGGSMSHADLMGRPRIITPAARGPPPPARAPIGTSSTSLDGHGPTLSSQHAGNLLAPPTRPGLGLRRVSSFSGPSGGNHAGVGAVYNDLPAESLPPRRLGRRGSIVGTPPAPIRRDPGFEDSTGTVMSTTSTDSGSTYRPRPRMVHQRTASESTVSTITRPSASGLTRDHASPPDGSVRLGLGRPEQAVEIGKLIRALHALTPPTRVRIEPSPRASILHPSSILTPFAVTLEALVAERTVILHPDKAIADLPTLRDGSSFHLSETGGEIEWTVLRSYIQSLGDSLDRLLPFIQTSPDQSALEDMIRSIRMFVGKIKKVFSEIVSGYGDNYGFMKGMWDDRSMKACAGEIGRWCDLFDA